MAQVLRDKHYKQAKDGRKKFQRFEFIGRAKPIEANEDRTVEVVFSSDEEVDMWYGKERLEHGNSNVDLSYLNAKKSPLLIDHRTWDSDNQIGVIDSARIADGKGYAIVRFGNSQRATEYYQDVTEGIRSCISVGYEVHEWTVEDADTDNPLWIATDWAPREISLVTFPADDTAEVIRAERKDYMFELQPDSEEDDDMLTRHAGGNPEAEKAEAEVRAKAEEAKAKAEADAKAKEATEAIIAAEKRKETTTTTTTGDETYGAEAHKIFALARDMEIDTEKAYRAVQNQQSFEDFQSEVLKEMKASRAEIDPKTGELSVDLNKENRFESTAVEPKDKDKFRITELMVGKLEGFEGKRGGFEKEICDEEATRRRSAGMEVHGLAVPGSIVGTASEWRARQAEKLHLQQRAVIAGTDASGGYLVDSELRPENFIDVLYGEFAVSRASTMLMDVKGDISIPKQDGRVTATWKGEIAAADESNPTFENITLSPKELRVLSRFSRTFAIQSSLDAENLARRNIMRGLGEVLDDALIYGSGASNQIGGVGTINAIGSTTASERTQLINYTKANLAYSDTLSAIENMGNNKIPMGMGMEWIASWKFWKDAKQVAMLTNGSIPIWYEDMICDFPASATSQIKQGTQHAFGTTTDLVNADHAFVANWTYLLVAMWGGLDLVIDPYTNLDTSQIRVVGFYRVDCGFAYDEAFIALQRTA